MNTSSANSSQPPATPINVQRNAWGKLVLTDDRGENAVEVNPVRMFPISDPQHWVSLCTADGHEVLCIEDMLSLDETIRHMLEDELSSHEFIPVIQRVYSVSSLSEPCEWDVQTDRGRTRFVLNSEDDVRRLGPHRAFIVDSHGIRFLIRDARQLDVTSRRYVEWYL